MVQDECERTSQESDRSEEEVKALGRMNGDFEI